MNRDLIAWPPLSEIGRFYTYVFMNILVSVPSEFQLSISCTKICITGSAQPSAPLFLISNSGYICDLLQEKVFIFQNENFLGERGRVLVFPFFRLSYPLSQHLEAKGLQIEFFKFYHVKEDAFSRRKKKEKKIDFLEDKYLFLEKVTNNERIQGLIFGHQSERFS